MRVRYLLLSILLGPDGIRALRQPIGRITSLNRNKLVTDEADTAFYRSPRLVNHADDAWLRKLTALYRSRLPSGGRVLDLMSSHVSHLPEDVPLERVDGHGMNEEELKANPAFAGGSVWVHDLNQEPALPFAEDAAYDAVLCCCGVQYLQEAEQVFAECSRVRRRRLGTRPGRRVAPAASSPGAHGPGALVWLLLARPRGSSSKELLVRLLYSRVLSSAGAQAEDGRAGRLLHQLLLLPEGAVRLERAGHGDARFEPSTKPPWPPPRPSPSRGGSESGGPLLHTQEGRLSSLEACRGLMGPPQRAPKTRSHRSPLAGARSLCETTCARPAASAPSHVEKRWKQQRTPPCSAGPRPEAQASGCMAMGRPAGGPSGRIRRRDCCVSCRRGGGGGRRHRAGRAAREHQRARRRPVLRRDRDAR